MQTTAITRVEHERRLGLSIGEAAVEAGVSRDLIYAAIREKRLVAKSLAVGRLCSGRTLIGSLAPCPTSEVPMPIKLLPEHAEAIARAVLGEPSARTRSEVRFGSKGALKVTIAGPGSGLWYDHAAGEGGGLLALVERTLGVSRAEAAEFVKTRVRDHPQAAPPTRGMSVRVSTLHRSAVGRRCKPGARPRPSREQSLSGTFVTGAAWTSAGSTLNVHFAGTSGPVPWSL